MGVTGEFRVNGEMVTVSIFRLTDRVYRKSWEVVEFKIQIFPVCNVMQSTVVWALLWEGGLDSLMTWELKW